MDLVNELAFGWYSLDDQGNLLTIDRKTGWQKPSGWEEVLQSATAYQLDTSMTILCLINDPRMMSILSNKGKTEQAIQSIMEEAKLFQGINLNMERLRLK